MGLIVILLPCSVMYITLNYSLGYLSEFEIENDMKTFANIARSEYNDEFKEIQQFANLLVRRNAFVTLFEQRDAAALHTLIAYEIGVVDMDFAMIVDPDTSVFITDSTDISLDVTQFSQLVKDSLQGKTISSTETVILKNPDKEHYDTVLVQVYLTPIQINEQRSDAAYGQHKFAYWCYLSI